MPQIKINADYITLINLFTVAPAHQLGLLRVQLGDIYWYGTRQPGNISANFHKSFDGTRVFNYGQWRSVEELEKSRKTQDFQKHLDNMRFFDFKIEPSVYQVDWISAAEPLEIETGNIAFLSICQTNEQDRLIEVQRKFYDGFDNKNKSAGYLATALHRGINSNHIAVYTQWKNLEAAQDWYASPVYQEYFRQTSDFCQKIDSNLYIVGGTSEDY